MSERIYKEVVKGWPERCTRQFPPERFHHHAATGSTNDDLLARIRSGEGQHFDVIVADYQKSGRGRRGDKWEAPPEKNLLFSFALRLGEDRKIWTRLPHLTAYLIGTAIESILPVDIRLQAKWPNDLLVDGKKLVGILVETVMVPEPFAVIGVGLNVNVKAEQFPDSIHELATSLYELMGCESSRWFLLGLVLRGFLAEYPDRLANFDEVHEWLDHRSFLWGKQIRVETSSGVFEGIGRGLASGGELLLEKHDGDTCAIMSAEKIVLC